MQIADAMQFLHMANIVHRDLKPSNVFVAETEDGTPVVKLLDFGLAKILQGDEQATSFCGTPEYMAPEILNDAGHAFPVDWWALGILTYEMIVSFPPFYTGGRDPTKMYELIKKKDVFFPDAKKHGIAMSDECKDFISCCLKKSPTERLGSNGGLEEILKHPWFADLDPQKMFDKEYTPEYIPKLGKSVFDVS